MVYEYSGFVTVNGARSKSTPHVFDSIRNIITKIYNANGHKVDTLHGDCEKVNLSLAQPLGAISCTLVASLPADHAHRVERTVQTLIGVCSAMLASLSYHLPDKYILPLLQAAAYCRNSLVTPKTSPFTPNELVLHSPPSTPPFPFGHCCMVTVPIDKRISNAKLYETYPKLESKTELGVCMGHDSTTGGTLFLLANGFIVPRSPTPMLINVIPFDWKRKEYPIPDNSPIG